MPLSLSVLVVNVSKLFSQWSASRFGTSITQIRSVSFGNGFRSCKSGHTLIWLATRSNLFWNSAANQSYLHWPLSTPMPIAPAIWLIDIWNQWIAACIAPVTFMDISCLANIKFEHGLCFTISNPIVRVLKFGKSTCRLFTSSTGLSIMTIGCKICSLHLLWEGVMRPTQSVRTSKLQYVSS